MWLVRTTEIFDKWFTDLGVDGQVEVIATVELLKRLGPQLGRPHADTLNGSKHANMKELRASTANKVLRIAIAFDPERNGILLVAGDKSHVSQKRFYKQLIAKADMLYDAHLAKLKSTKKRNNMAKSFDDLVKRTTTKKIRQRATVRAQELLRELLLSEIRELRGKSQKEIADAIGIKQPSLSKLEKQADMQISTLRKIVKALGGELEVLAKFPKGVVRLDQFGKGVRRHKHDRTGPGELQLV